MYAFDYKRPSSLDEAAELLRNSDDALVLAGGHTLLPTLKQRLASPSDLVDLSAIDELTGISSSDGTVTIGAMTTHAQVAASSQVRDAIPALADLAGGIGDPQVRNKGTMGGSISNNDPAADYPAALVALRATINTTSRSVSADDFFTGMFETVLDDGEIVTSVSFQVPSKAAYCKFPNPASRYAIVGVFVAQGSDGVRVAVTGAGGCVFRVSEMEAALNQDFAASSVADVQVSDDGLNEDIHASAQYRAHLITVMAKRAVDKANG
ncbi:MAG: xanthine dehydrogenase family protein subunit M [Acidiferrobacterales bacterium]|nr:xanthine dehydrogenase family protein subunit M [Acidiferrobacterales bacterium]